MSKEKFIETYKKCTKIKKLKKNLKCNLCNLLIENADEVTFFSNERQMIKFFIYFLINFPFLQVKNNKKENLQKIADCFFYLKDAKKEKIFNPISICKFCLIKISNQKNIIDLIRSLFLIYQNERNINNNNANNQSNSFSSKGNNTLKIDLDKLIVVDDNKINNNQNYENNNSNIENNLKIDKTNNIEIKEDYFRTFTHLIFLRKYYFNSNCNNLLQINYRNQLFKQIEEGLNNMYYKYAIQNLEQNCDANYFQEVKYNQLKLIEIINIYKKLKRIINLSIY